MKKLACKRFDQEGQPVGCFLKSEACLDAALLKCTTESEVSKQASQRRLLTETETSYDTSTTEGGGKEERWREGGDGMG